MVKANVLMATAIAAVLAQTAWSATVLEEIGTSSYLRYEGLRYSKEIFDLDAYDSQNANANGYAYSEARSPYTNNPGDIVGLPSTGWTVGGSITAKVNTATGSLHTTANGWMACGADSDASGFMSGTAIARIADILTLDQAATVTIVGHVTGLLSGSANDETSNVRAATSATFGFQKREVIPGDGEWWNTIGYDEVFRVEFNDYTGTGSTMPMPPPTPFTEYFSVSIDLDAGDNYFLAELWSNLDMVVYEDGACHINMDFGNTAQFQIIVPEGVMATSKSGLLPIATTVPEPGCLGLLTVAGALLLQRRR